MNPSTVQIIAAAIFTIAVLHTFMAKFFEGLAHRYRAHAGLFHLLGEVEAVFGFWALVLMIFMAFSVGLGGAVGYLEGLNYTEPLFVFVIMVIAASKPILRLALASVAATARLLPMRASLATYFLSLSLLPLLGSFITEPAAMTLAALLLRARYYNAGISSRLMYATIGVLFVNVSIGGTLTPYAAPPVLMVAAKWGWDLPFMIMNLGWRSALAVIVNAGIVTILFRHELARVSVKDGADQGDPIPAPMILLHVLFLAAVVVAAHHPVVFMGLFLFFLGIASAYERYQDRLILREGLMVAFFLAGLVVLGGQQQWWLQPALQAMSPTAVYYGATALTAGGLTVIANAPNPAGYSILRGSFENQEISAGGLFLAAFPPTLVAIIMFRAF